MNENIKAFRRAKGLTQEELAVRLNVVRQTVSKWEQGRSVPDADLLISISEVLETSVSTLLGETVTEPKADDLKVISEKLEGINLQLARMKENRRKTLHVVFAVLCALIVIIAVILFLTKSPYLNWDFSDPEAAVVGTVYHAFEFVFVRLAPFALIGAAAGLILTRKKG